MHLRGTVRLCGPDHVGLILHETFNCSVPRWGLDEGLWEFVQGHNDGGEDGWGNDASGWGNEGSSGQWLGETGWWNERRTGARLGGNEGRVDFTVVGYVWTLTPLSPGLTISA